MRRRGALHHCVCIVELCTYVIGCIFMKKTYCTNVIGCMFIRRRTALHRCIYEEDCTYVLCCEALHRCIMYLCNRLYLWRSREVVSFVSTQRTIEAERNSGIVGQQLTLIVHNTVSLLCIRILFKSLVLRSKVQITCPPRSGWYNFHIGSGWYNFYIGSGWYKSISLLDLLSLSLSLRLSLYTY